MLTVRSYPIDDTLLLPKSSTVLYCGEWQGSIHVYILCSPEEQETEEYEFKMVTTDRPFENTGWWVYSGSVTILAPWHVFYRKKPLPS
jgi:hypothetical protein